MSLQEDWGNPHAASFKQRYIRGVKAGGVKVQLHKELVDVATAMLLEAAEANGGTLPTMTGWQPVDPDEQDTPVQYGIAFEYSEAVEPYSAKWGFEVDGGMFVFNGSPSDADLLSQKAETRRLAENFPDSQSEGVWYAGGPGSRPIGMGDMGDDVMCFQLATDCPTQSGNYDEATASYAKTLNHRYGITHDTASVNEDTWKGLLKLRRGIISRGDVGAHVRVLQAALVAYDWDTSLRITGNYDRRTEAAVREVQETLGLRQSGMVRHPEWYALLRVEPEA